MIRDSQKTKLKPLPIINECKILQNDWGFTAVAKVLEEPIKFHKLKIRGIISFNHFYGCSSMWPLFGEFPFVSNQSENAPMTRLSGKEPIHVQDFLLSTKICEFPLQNIGISEGQWVKQVRKKTFTQRR